MTHKKVDKGERVVRVFFYSVYIHILRKERICACVQQKKKKNTFAAVASLRVLASNETPPQQPL